MFLFFVKFKIKIIKCRIVKQRISQIIGITLQTDFNSISKQHLKNMSIRTLLFLSLIVSIMSTYDPSYFIYLDRLTGPYNSSIPTYGNYDLNPTPTFTYGNGERVNIQKSLYTTMDSYYKEEFQRGAQYSLQYYKDSTMSTTTTVLYKKTSMTHTYRYYYLWVKNGNAPLNGTYINLGFDTCQSCRAGRQMPLLHYKQIDLSINPALLSQIVNVLNTARKSSYLREAIAEIKYWQLPNGTLYIANLKLPNLTTLSSVFLDTPNNYMRCINSIIIPNIYGNIPVDYVYVFYILEQIVRTSNVTLNPPAWINQIYFFEYFLDPFDKDIYTYMLNIQNHGNVYSFRIMGTYQPYINIISNEQVNNIRNRQNYTSLLKFPNITTPYFNNNNRDMRIGSNVTSDIEYNSLLVALKGVCQAPTSLEVVASNLFSLFYIDFPNHMRQYMVDFYCEPDKRASHYYFYVDKTTLKFLGTTYKRVTVGNQTFNNNSNWASAAQRLYEYNYQYGLLTKFRSSSVYSTNSHVAQYFTNTLSPYSQYCQLVGGRLELMIASNFFNRNISANIYPCLNRMIFMKDILTDRIYYFGNFTPSKTSCDFSSSYAYPKQACDDAIATTLDQIASQNLYNSLSKNFKDSFGQIFEYSEMTDLLMMNISKVGPNAPLIYYISFTKNEVTSSYIVSQSNTGALSILDYVEDAYGVYNPDKLPSIVGSNPSSNPSHKNVTNSSSANSSANKPSSSSPNSTSSPSTSTSCSPTTSSSNSSSSSSSSSPSSPSSSNSPASTQLTNSSSSTLLNIGQISNTPTSSSVFGSGKLTFSFIQSVYSNLSSLIKTNDPSASQSRPIIYYFIDDYSELTAYAVLYSYPPSIYVVYQIISLASNNTFLFVGKSYVPSLPSSPSSFWQIKPITSVSELLQQTANYISTNPNISNASAKNVSLGGITFYSGGYYFVNVTFTNGFILHASFLRYNISWYPIYAYLIPPPLPLQNSNSNIPSLIVMTDADMKKDAVINGVLSLQEILSLVNGYALSQVSRGTFSNGTIYYQIIYYTRTVSSSIIIYILYNPNTLSVISAHYKQETIQTQPTPSDIAKATAGNPSNQKTIVDKIIQASKSQHQELNSHNIELIYHVVESKEYYTYMLKYTLPNGQSYCQTVQIPVVSLKFKEVAFSKSCQNFI